ncbi:hypothetical protein ACWDKQ_32225 [Saccharopolyspora sp. NPDC000995]
MQAAWGYIRDVLHAVLGDYFPPSRERVEVAAPDPEQTLPPDAVRNLTEADYADFARLKGNAAHLMADVLYLGQIVVGANGNDWPHPETAQVCLRAASHAAVNQQMDDELGGLLGRDDEQGDA